MAEISAMTSLIPLFLEAESKEELIKNMLLNNKVNAKKFNYMQPVLEGKVWVVWFYADIENYTPIDNLSKEQRVAVEEISP